LLGGDLVGVGRGQIDVGHGTLSQESEEVNAVCNKDAIDYSHPRRPGQTVGPAGPVA